jgi:hypothetical protein
MLASLLGLNPWVSFLCSLLIIASMLWGLIWGGIRLWHKRATRSLKEAFQEQVAPILVGMKEDLATKITEVKERLDDQDAVLEHVEHEVSLNSGTSVKDGVNALRREGEEHTRQLKEVKAEQTKAAQLQVVAAERIEDLRIAQEGHISYHRGFEDAQKHQN